MDLPSPPLPPGHPTQASEPVADRMLPAHPDPSRPAPGGGEPADHPHPPDGGSPLPPIGVAERWMCGARSGRGYKRLSYHRQQLRC
jgi:hypothetical protein